jgi:HAD superfamily phosphoserine phosphatase-like hydrolase
MSTLPLRRWEPTIHRRLTDMAARWGRHGDAFDPLRPPIATFDWDNTSIRGDIGEAVLEHLDARDGGRRVATYEEKLRAFGKPVAYPWAACALAGTTAAELREIVVDVVDERVLDGRIALRPEMQDLYAELEIHGWEVWVVSASAEAIVAPFAAFYGVPPTRVIGMRLAADERGRLLPDLAGPATYRQGKLEAIDRLIGRRPTFAAGDADTDLEMLHAAECRLVIDRGDPALLEAAQAGDWWIQPLTF